MTRTLRGRIRPWLRRVGAGGLAGLACGVALGGTDVAPLPSGARSEAVRLAPLPGVAGEGVDGHFFARAGADVDARPRGALVLLHGCGGPWRTATSTPDGARRLDARMAEVVDLAHRAGWHALVVDSFGPRGVRELCTQRIGSRSITQRERRADALAALAWLAAQPGVDPARLGLVGWSHGGSTVLAALDASHPQVRAAPVHPSFAVAHYPGCAADAARGWRPVAPLLLLLAADDDWTPVAPCRTLAAAANAAAADAAGPMVDTVVYPAAVHGFDGPGPVRRRADVPNGVDPGAGVSTGREPRAAADARARLADLLQAPAPGATTAR